MEGRERGNRISVVEDVESLSFCRAQMVKCDV